MKKTLLRIGLCLVSAISCQPAHAQIEIPSVDSFDLEIDTVDDWYKSASDTYQFDMKGISRTFGDPISGPDFFFVTPGEDILDNQMLTNLLARIGPMNAGRSYTVDDTSHFSYPFGNGGLWTFNKYSHYECTRKPCSAINLDGDVFTNVSVYQVVEVTELHRSDGYVWRRLVSYYAIHDAGNTIISCLSYWRNGGGIFSGNMKYVQNSRSYKPQLPAGNAVTMYAAPIPANAYLLVNLTANADIDHGYIEIIEMMYGNTMLRVETGSMKRGDRTCYRLDLSNVRPGTYILRVTTNAGNTYSRISIVR